MDASWMDQKAQPTVYQLSLTQLTNPVEALTSLSDWVNSLIPQLNLSPRGAFQLELVLVEVVTNTIEHGYEDATNHEIAITLQSQEQTIQVTVRDDGRPFDPSQSPGAVMPNSLEEATEGGLGIHLIRSYTKVCHYQREEPYNLLTLVLQD